MRTEVLRTLATNFGSNTALSAKAIREIYVSDPAGFVPAVAEVLRGGANLEGASFLMAILVTEPEWMRLVCNPEKYTLDQSLDLVRRARKLDPLTEVKLAKMLAALPVSNDEEGRFASRALEVLERSPDPSTTLPALRHLSQCTNGKIRSKAALLIGRIVRNPQWSEQTASELDPRVAANAIESLWGVSSDGARKAFFRASLNTHHRIAANGIIGLYLMADPSGIPFLFHLGRSENPLARAAAGWAMGHLEDPRFLPALARLMEDPDAMTRKGAFKSISRIRQKMSHMRATGELRVQIRDCECRGVAHLIRFTVDHEAHLVKNLDLRRFVVWNGPDVVEEFFSSMREEAPPCYEVEYQAPPSLTNLVKVQVYAESGVGEDTGFEMTFP